MSHIMSHIASYCWMNFGLDFESIGIVKNLCCGLVWICSWYMWKSLLACVNFVLWTWQNFVGMCMDKFVGMDKFCGHETLTYGKNFVGYVMLFHGKFLWLWFWLCENLLAVHRHVEIIRWLSWSCRNFCAWLWKKIW